MGEKYSNMWKKNTSISESLPSHRDPVRRRTDPAAGAPDLDAPMVGWTDPVLEAPDQVLKLSQHKPEHREKGC
jgi:hypothetical protein